MAHPKLPNLQPFEVYIELTDAMLQKKLVTVSMNTISLYDRLERLCNLLRSEARTDGARVGLQPVQLEALRYLAVCNRYSNTPQAVTDYLGSTKGTVSQTLNVLEKKGLLFKHPDKEDKRVVRLNITTAGRRILSDTSPAPYLNQVSTLLPVGRINALNDSLEVLLRAIQQANGLKTFGLCRSCRFNRQHEDAYFCALTKETLSKSEIELICREHEFPENRKLTV